MRSDNAYVHVPDESTTKNKLNKKTKLSVFFIIILLLYFHALWRTPLQEPLLMK